VSKQLISIFKSVKVDKVLQHKSMTETRTHSILQHKSMIDTRIYFVSNLFDVIFGGDPRLSVSLFINAFLFLLNE